MKVEINDTTLEFIEEGSGDPVLFVHGSNSDYRTWIVQQKEFSKKFKTFNYSRRYHYPNEPIPEEEDYSMSKQLDDLQNLLQYIDDKPINLVGHSYGAFLCLLLAIRSPNNIKSLVLIEPPIFTLFLSIPPSVLQILKLLISKPRTAIPIIKFANSGINPATKAANEDNVELAFQIFTKALLGDEFYNNLSKERLEQAHANLFKAEFLGIFTFRIKGC